MSHYNENIAKAARECAEHRKFIDNLDGVDAELLEGMTPLKHADSTNSWAITDFKDTKGKAEGARYCYLADIANCVLGGINNSKGYRDSMNNVGETLSVIVRAYDKKWLLDVKHYCSVLIKDLLELDSGLHHELIKVRANALNSGKYKTEGYREEIDVRLLLDAAARHFIKKLMVGDIDEESGCTHEAHIAANAIMIHTQLSLHGG